MVVVLKGIQGYIQMRGQICGKQFKDDNYVKKHLLIHTAETSEQTRHSDKKDFKYQQCGI